jgi:hypothetical protein
MAAITTDPDVARKIRNCRALPSQTLRTLTHELTLTANPGMRRDRWHGLPHAVRPPPHQRTTAFRTRAKGDRRRCEIGRFTPLQ